MTQYCQSEFSDYALQGWTGTRERLGVKIESGSTWIGNEVSSVKYWLMQSGSSGTIYCRIYRDGTASPIHTFGSVNTTSLNAGTAGFCDGGCNWSEHTFNTGGNYTLLVNDILCVENDNGSGTIMYVSPYYGGEPNNLLQMRYDGTNWSEAGGESLRLCIDTPTIPPGSSGGRLPPPPIRLTL